MIKHPVLIGSIATLFTSFNALAIVAVPVRAESLRSTETHPTLISQDVQTPIPADAPSNPNSIKRPVNLKFGLADGTEVKLKFKQTISSKDAKVNDPVEFEVAETVRVNGKVVIAQGAPARGTVVDVQRSGMLGRKGKLDIAIKEVTLLSGERVSLRASQKSGGGTSGGVIAVAALISPLALLFKGKNTTYEAGTEVTAFVEGNFELAPNKF
jgi:hypothetical protein